MSAVRRQLALFLLLAAAAAGSPAAGAAQSPPRTPGVSGMPHGVPLLCREPTVTSLANGAWSVPGTWSTGAVPGADDRVAIAAGHDVTYDVVSDAALACVEVQGRLAFSSIGNTRLKVGTVMVLEGGRLEIGSPAAPVAAAVTGELIIADRPIDPAVDPDQVGNGLVALGAVAMHGAEKTPTFVRLGREPRAGDTTLELAGPVSGWAAGDHIVIPDTRQLRLGGAGRRGRSQTETVEIASVAGAQVTLAAPLRRDHAGARDGGGALGFLPHAANLSRNVIVRSENPRGTRGHTMFISRADVDLRYAAFVELGRTRNGAVDSTRLDTRGRTRRIGTNQLGRYAVHFHHAFGPRTPPANGYQFTLIGNAVDGAPKWGITVHRSHYGLVRDNVVYDTRGAGIATEDGSESFNVFDHNFSVRSAGQSASLLGAGYGGSVPGVGVEGAGFWFRGPNNYIRNNVAADARTYGFGLPAELGSVRVPAFQGADTSRPGEAVLTDMANAAVLEFADNEAYGALETGLETIWNGTVSGLTVWQPSRQAFAGNPPERLVLDGLTVRGDLAGPVLEDQIDALGAAARLNPRLDLSRVAIRGWSFGGYLAALAVLRRPDVFAAAIAGAPVTDWRLYDTHYTERYLGHPDTEPTNYERTDLTLLAPGLQRPLMLIHGLADDNVVAAHTLRLSQALTEAGRPHTVLPLSGITHMTPQEEVAENLLLLQLRFLQGALGMPPLAPREQQPRHDKGAAGD